MPAASNIDFNQRAMVLAITAPCGFRIAINSLDSPFLRLRSRFVFFKGSAWAKLPEKEGKKNSDADLRFALTVLLVY